jgi:imidazolonepropionase-like amidohydrolase
MAPMTLQRLVKELDKLKPDADAARLKSHDYARRLVRMIRQLRERGLSAHRAAATAALAEALERGVITVPVEARLR